MAEIEHTNILVWSENLRYQQLTFLVEPWKIAFKDCVAVSVPGGDLANTSAA